MAVRFHQDRSDSITRFAKWSRKHDWLIRSGVLTIAYSVWTLLFRLLILSFITYFLMPSASQLGIWGNNEAAMPTPAVLPRFEEIGEVFSSNELPLIGLSALVFVAFLCWLNPLTSTKSTDLISFERLRKRFIPGALHGIVFATGIVVAFLLSGLYRYLGFFIQLEDVALALPGLFLRITLILMFVYCEEFIYRQKIMGSLRSGFLSPEYRMDRLQGEMIAATLTGILYCSIKALQFDLGVMHLISLFLASIALSLRTLADRDFVRGAGFWAAILIVFHPIFSLPLLGNDFSGILLFKYQAGAQDLVGTSDSGRFLTGGSGGPLSGFAFQALLMIDIARSGFRYKKILLRPQQSR
ncbi:MAG TPA: hypothetical protein VJB59_14420 [Bdellovibrionota bacterium]|nr:hypothetical protein [Bdellovibrionota bacterium]